MHEYFLVGIDFGAKMAGTTAVAFLEEGKLVVLQSEKGKDADHWLDELLSNLPPSLICLDAPLSLPMAYFETNGGRQDYFYREADKRAMAMSPMFLGGLTARAMRLKAQCSKHNFYETYPKMLANELNLKALGYKTQFEHLSPCWETLSKHFNVASLDSKPSNWHQFDAILALYTAHRIIQGNAQQLGEKEEGLIWF